MKRKIVEFLVMMLIITTLFSITVSGNKIDMDTTDVEDEEGDYINIQDKIVKAKKDYIIDVDHGTYNENIEGNNKEVYLGWAVIIGDGTPDEGYLDVNLIDDWNFEVEIDNEVEFVDFYINYSMICDGFFDIGEVYISMQTLTPLNNYKNNISTSTSAEGLLYIRDVEAHQNCRFTFEFGATYISFPPYTQHQSSISHGKFVLGGGCCFPAGTKITMADGSYKNIENIHFGDRVLSYDIEKSKFSSWRVKLLGDPVHPVYEINNGLLSFTKDHPIRVKKPDGSIGWGSADINAVKKYTRLKKDILKIEAGDYIYTTDEEWIEIENIEFKPKLVQTYNIMSFSGTKTYFANDVLVFEENPPIRVWIQNNFYLRGYIDAWKNALLDLIG